MFSRCEYCSIGKGFYYKKLPQVKPCLLNVKGLLLFECITIYAINDCMKAATQ